MRKYFLATGLLVASCVSWAMPTQAYQTQNLDVDYNNTVRNNSQLGGFENTENGPAGGPIIIASQIINVLLGVLGTLCLALIFYAGYLWLMSRGNEEQVTKARNIIIGTITGLALILASYGITYYVFRSLVNITN